MHGLVACPVRLGAGSAGWAVAPAAFVRSWVRGGGAVPCPPGPAVPVWWWRVYLSGCRLCGRAAAVRGGGGLYRRACGGSELVCGGLVWRCPTFLGAFPSFPGCEACLLGLRPQLASLALVLWCALVRLRRVVLCCAAVCPALLCRAVPCRAVVCLTVSKKKCFSIALRHTLVVLGMH